MTPVRIADSTGIKLCGKLWTLDVDSAFGNTLNIVAQNKLKPFAFSQQIYLKRNLFHSQHFSVEFNSFWNAIYS